MLTCASGRKAQGRKNIMYELTYIEITLTNVKCKDCIYIYAVDADDIIDKRDLFIKLLDSQNVAAVCPLYDGDIVVDGYYIPVAEHMTLLTKVISKEEANDLTLFYAQEVMDDLTKNHHARPLKREQLPMHDYDFVSKYMDAAAKASASGIIEFKHDGLTYIVANNKEEGTAIYGGVKK